jgi:hypothetical protein
MARSLRSRAPAPPGAQAGGPPVAASGGAKAEALRRLQTGAMGVVAVLLLIGLASIIKDSATQAESTTVPGAAPTTAPGAPPTAADPLAQAGVVPEISGSPTDAQTEAAPAAPDAR